MKILSSPHPFHLQRPALTPKNIAAALFLLATAIGTYACAMKWPEDTCCIITLAFVLAMTRRFAAQPCAFFLRVTVFALVLFSIAAINLFVPEALRLGDDVILRRTLYACVAIAYLPLALVLFVAKKKPRRLLFAAAYAFATVPLVFLWGYFFLAHRWATADTMLAIYQTNLSEAAAFWSDQMGWSGTLFALALVAAVVLFGRWLAHLSAQPPRTKKARAAACALFLLPLAIFTFFCIPKNDMLYSRIGAEGYFAITQLTAFRAHHAEHANELAALPPIAGGAGGVHVLVIGESQNRQYMHAYGGPDGTTPWLDTKKDAPDCILFQHAYSNHTYTVAALSYALTEKNQYNDIDMEQAFSLIELAKAAGYRTAFISNQGKNGAGDTPVSVIASDADVTIFLNEHQYSDHLHYDGALVAAFDEAVQQLRLAEDAAKDALIVVHLMGCHARYQDRYPKDGAPLPTDTREDVYKNAVHYNDEVMQSLYAHANVLPGFRDFTFFSDHGENLTKEATHDPDRYEPDMTYIPFYLLFSDEAAAARPALYQALRENAGKPWTNDLLYELQITLLGLTPPHAIEPENNIASPAYDGDITRLRTCHGAREITPEEST